MKLEHEIMLNKYGQGIIAADFLINLFIDMNTTDQKIFLSDFLFVIMQSKPLNEDIEETIEKSGLKPTFTPCTMLKKGIDINNLKKIILLPDNERLKSFRLFLELYKIAYQRRFKTEKNHPNKWWYWDLSSPETEDRIYGLHNT